MTSDRFEELESLLLDWEDGTLDESGVERLREILKDDSEARSQFVRLQMMNAAMSLEGDAGVLPSAAQEISDIGNGTVRHSEERSASTRRKTPTRLMLAAVVLLFGVLAGRLVQLEVASWAPKNPGGIDEPGENVIAIERS
jgi:hypothetical protein